MRKLSELVIIIVVCVSVKAQVRIEPLTISKSVVTEVRGEICILQTYSFIRTKVLTGKIFRQIHDNLNKVHELVGRYASAADETYNIARYRSCEKGLMMNGVCPLSSVTLLTDSAAKMSRIDVITNSAKIDIELGRLLTKLNQFPKQLVSPDPTFTPQLLELKAPWTLGKDKDSQDVPTGSGAVNKVYYPRLFRSVAMEKLRFLDESKETDSKLVMEAGKEAQTFINLHTKMEEAYSLLVDLVKAIENLAEGRFPEALFPYDLWIERFLNIIDSSESQEIQEQIRFTISVLTHTLLTAVRVNPACNPLDQLSTIKTDCDLHTITLVPDHDQLRRMEKIVFTPHPVAREGIWKKVKLSMDQFLREGAKLFEEAKQLNCLGKWPQVNCEFCDAANALKVVVDPCLLAIFQETALDDVCDLEEVSSKDVPTLQIIHDPDQNVTEIISTSLNAGAILENCTGTDQTLATPEAARITVQSSCAQVRMVNPPTVHEISPLLAISKVTILPIQVQTFTNLVKTQVTKIKTHFENHGYIYIIAIVCAVFIIICSATCKCCHHVIQRNFRKYIQNYQRMHSQGVTITEEPSTPKIAGQLALAPHVTYRIV